MSDTQRSSSPAVIWLTGLSAAGKSVIGDRVFEKLKQAGCAVSRLDGDLLREIFPTGFSAKDRDEHCLRAGFIAGELEKNGICVVASFISPLASTRTKVRSLCKTFIEVHVSTSLEVCEARDPKGLYRKARSGEITNLTGIGDPYERPLHAEVVVDGGWLTIEDAADIILQKVREA